MGMDIGQTVLIEGGDAAPLDLIPVPGPRSEAPISNPSSLPSPLSSAPSACSEFLPSSPPSSPPVSTRSSGPSAFPSPLPSSEFLTRIPREFARRHLILSAGTGEDGAERLRISARTRPAAVLNVATRLGVPVQTVIIDDESIAAAVDRTYGDAAAAASARAAADPARADSSSAHGSAAETPQVVVDGSTDLEADLDSAVHAAEQDLLNVQGKAPSVRLVDLILFEALLTGCSDVHVQPLRDRTLVRYRLDGTLRTSRQLPAALAATVVSRIKVMARMDVAERRAAQDGRAGVTIGGSGSTSSQPHSGRRVDLRISVLPSTYGERVVIRLLDPSRSPHMLSFSALGMPAKVERDYLAIAARTSGILLSTGPTGSGKTTTLYTTLAWINAANSGAAAPPLPCSPSSHSSSLVPSAQCLVPPPSAQCLVPARASRGCELNIMTVEDPVEYDLSSSGGAGLAVSQTQVDPKKNLTFASGLRHILRQDPDVIMVGEIRDEETARIAVQASLTGHLVLSTLHTSDAAGAVARLIDLGVEPFLVSSTLAGVLAQRLVRTRHGACAGAGCPECLHSGFKGRLGVFELLVMDGPIRDLVGERASAARIKAAAEAAGMVSLRSAGAALVRAGLTTPAEVARVIEALDEEDLA